MSYFWCGGQGWSLFLWSLWCSRALAKDDADKKAKAMFLCGDKYRPLAELLGGPDDVDYITFKTAMLKSNRDQHIFGWLEIKSWQMHWQYINNNSAWWWHLRLPLWGMGLLQCHNNKHGVALVFDWTMHVGGGNMQAEGALVGGILFNLWGVQA